MLLGILFATSKQYSDKLSVDVSRGTSGNIKEGKYNGVIKKGYYVDKNTWHFIPDATTGTCSEKQLICDFTKVNQRRNS